MEKKTKKRVASALNFFFAVLFLSLPFCGAYANEGVKSLRSAAPDYLVNPAAGVWANYQTLVLDLPEGAEAFYSLNGEDPFVSGFAYDGPVVLSVAGSVVLRIVVTDGSAPIFKTEIPYTVVPQEEPAYIKAARPFSADEAFLRVNSCAYIDLPESVSYTAGPSPVFFTGRRLMLPYASVYERFVPLAVYDGEVPFRYVLLTGGDAETSPGSENTAGAADGILPADTLPEFDDWNYAAFKTPFPVFYAIDEGPVRVSASARIRIDRTKPHMLYWKIGDAESKAAGAVNAAGADGTQNALGLSGAPLSEFNRLFIPPKPELQGLPAVPFVNRAVNLSFDNPDFLFCSRTKDGKKLYSPVFSVDALEGDAFGFSENIDVLYKGLKQGSVRPSFIIDKIPPSAPVFVSSEKDFYARKDIVLDIQSEGAVYYRFAETFEAEKGFSRSRIEDINRALEASLAGENEESFTRLSGGSLILTSGEKSARLYTVDAYSADAAGNKSPVVRFQTVADAVNFYASAAAEDAQADGSPDKPFGSFPALYAAVQKSASPFVRCMLEGTFSDIHPLLIERDTELCGDGKTRLQFEKDASLTVRNAFFNLKNCTLERYGAGETDMLQTYLVQAENAALSFSHAELICRDPNGVSCFGLKSSSLDADFCGFTAEGAVYADAVSAKDSVVNLQNVRSVVIAQTGVGVKSIRSSVTVFDSSFRLSGNFVRALEFLDSNFELGNNEFVSEKPMNGIGAVWSNVFPDIAIDVSGKNTYSGFSSLYASR